MSLSLRSALETMRTSPPRTYPLGFTKPEYDHCKPCFPLCCQQTTTGMGFIRCGCRPALLKSPDPSRCAHAARQQRLPIQVDPTATRPSCGAQRLSSVGRPPSSHATGWRSNQVKRKSSIYTVTATNRVITVCSCRTAPQTPKLPNLLGLSTKRLIYR